MLNARIREAWDRGMKPVGELLGRSGISPNSITVAALLVQGVVAYLIVEDELFAAAATATFAGLLDTLDGAVAKAMGRASKFGALLDSTLDRLGDALVFLPIGWLYLTSDGRADEHWVAALALVALTASFLVSYVKARAEGLGYECNVGLIERAERLIIVILGLALSSFLPLALAILALASIYTFVERLIHVRKQARHARA